MVAFQFIVVRVLTARVDGNASCTLCCDLEMIIGLGYSLYKGRNQIL